MKPIHYILIIAAIILGWFCYRKFKKEDKNLTGLKIDHFPTGVFPNDNDIYPFPNELLKAAANAGVDNVELYQNSDDERNEPSRYSVKINGKLYYITLDTFRALKKQDDYQVWD